MSERWAIALAGAAALGALAARPVPLVTVALILLAGLLGRNSIVLCLGVAVAASSFAATAWLRLDTPLPETVSGTATLTADPVRREGGRVVAEAGIGGRLFELSAPGDAGASIAGALAGERVEVTGVVGPLNGLTAPSLRRRHIAGRVLVETARPLDEGSLVARMGNGMRRVLASGASSMAPADRSLLMGLLIGDDREQTDEVTKQFRDSGLAHLLAVSGSNVAFVLLAVGPLLRCFGLTGRLVGGLAVLGLFGTITRWEPSVVRAEAMAAVVLAGAFLGRPISPWRCLGIAVTAVLLIDPFLVGSIGFLLSVGACIGMAALGAPLSDRLAGPMWLRQALGYTLAAQIGVAPVHVCVFGPMPIVAVFTNVLAEPAAGLVMVWGLAAGLLAGVLGEPFAAVLHGPSVLLVRWIGSVAEHGAAADLGTWDFRWLGVALGLLVIARRWRDRPGADRDYLRLNEQCPPRLPREGRRSRLGKSDGDPPARRARGGATGGPDSGGRA